MLNGAKMWITNGTMADVAVVWAKTGRRTIRGFLVEKGTPGLRAPRSMKRKLSLRASVTCELVLDDVQVPARRVLPGVERLKGPLSCLTQARYGIAWGAVGAAMACYDEALHYSQGARAVRPADRRLPALQAKLADMSPGSPGQLLAAASAG